MFYTLNILFTGTGLGAPISFAPIGVPVSVPPTNVETDTFVNPSGSCRVQIQNFTANTRAVNVPFALATGTALNCFVWITVQPLAPFVF